MSSFFVTDPSQYREPVVGVSPNGYDSQRPLTVIDVFQEIVRLHGERPALAFKRKDSEVKNINRYSFFEGLTNNLFRKGQLPKEFTIIDYQQYWNFCMQFAKSLIKLDVQAFRVINILGFNSVRTYWYYLSSIDLSNIGRCLL